MQNDILKNWKKIAFLVLVPAVIWHIVVALMAHIGVSGVFQIKPSPGYVWENTTDSDSRFLWQIARVSWQAGTAHPEFNAEAAEKEGDWNPQPGYAYVDQAKGLETVWTKGLVHPDYMAWSDEVEGKWIPVTGYKFIYEGDTFVDSVWDPNKRYDDIKVISLAEKDRYQPFPGYVFTEPGRSLKVVWSPGTVNSTNSRLVAGTQEGSWNVKPGGSSYRPRSSRSGNGNAAAFFGGVATGVFLRSL